MVIGGTSDQIEQASAVATVALDIYTDTLSDYNE